MDIIMTGRWVLMIIGSAAIIVAIILTVIKADPLRRLLVIWFFGVLLAGLGIFGMEFMPQYREWLDAVSELVNNPGQESYKNFLAKVGKDELPQEVQKIGISYAVNHPIEDIKSILENAVRNAPADKKGKLELKQGLSTLEAKQNVVESLLRVNPSAETVRRFDPAISELYYQELRALPAPELRRMDIRPNEIESFRIQ
jgi:hypothetical protein